MFGLAGAYGEAGDLGRAVDLNAREDAVEGGGGLQLAGDAAEGAEVDVGEGSLAGEREVAVIGLGERAEVAI